jgi:transcriptional regulator with XRE-family HTH domain
MELNEIGIAIRQARKSRRITQKDLATACGLSRATVNALESGKTQELGFGRVNALGNFLGLEISLSPTHSVRPRRPSLSIVLKRLRKRYIWWRIPGMEPDAERIIAQVMDIGTYQDVKTLETEVGRIGMKQALSDAQPGWFSAKSWEYWHLMLGLSRVGEVPPQPRRYDALQTQFQDATEKPAALVETSRSR